MSFLQVYHHSYEKYYREPFGAVLCGTPVLLRLKTLSHLPLKDCALRLWEAATGERFLPMTCIREEKRDGLVEQIFEVTYSSPVHPGPVWYYFRLDQEGNRYYYGNNAQGLGGEGTLSKREPLSYQLTVYRSAPVPRWYLNGVIYQIFVDRFCNAMKEGEFLHPKAKSLLHGNWFDTPFYLKDSQGRVVRWTFFGGNLAGIIQKLPYLQELGVTVIYLNPIFEAASNHKYDTGDYLKIDAMFGDEQVFRRLVREAGWYGISLILDGVFSHTGSDSLYFNKYGNYPGLGAFQSPQSPYSSWYKIDECGDEYECWWGVQDLPNVREMEPSYRDFIMHGKDSVIRHWMACGVRGWRLDVADELPDEFVKELRQAVKEVDPEAVLIGEVWEDASHKESYGRLRQYFWGEELDGVTNYPLREMLLEFILGKLDGKVLYRRMMSLYENYPRENFLAGMNLIGSHDRIRVLTLLGEAPEEETLSEEEKQNYRLPEDRRVLALQRLKLLSLLQMTLPGVPCIYYGDEVGVEGYSDPYNRGAYPWGREDRDLLAWYQRLIRLRREYYRTEDRTFDPFLARGPLFGFRWGDEHEEILVCVNGSPEDGAGFSLPSPVWEQGESPLMLELLSGEIPEEGQVSLRPLEGKVFYRKREGSPAGQSRAPRCGVLLHPTSLSSAWGNGDLGEEARNFVDFLAGAGQSLWQVLPLNPPGPGDSPYQSPSVFAGNELLVSVEALQEEGLLTEEELAEEQDRFHRLKGDVPASRANFLLTGEIKNRLCRKAFTRFKTGLETHSGAYLSEDNFQIFQEENRYWLPDYCLYAALKQSQGADWTKWEKPLAFRDPGTLAALAGTYEEEIAYQGFLQYIFFHQWRKLKRYANSRGIQIIGDLPFYAAGESCDTWSRPRQFELTEEGRPRRVAGVPPDYFSDTGQLWGHPLYLWPAMAGDGYGWWKERVRQALGLFDFVRFDHFRAFEGYWAVPAEEENAVQGHWLKGPGKRFFEELTQEFGPLPVIAEDLGFITPEVRNLKNIFGFPGMGVLQFEALDQENKEWEAGGKSPLKTWENTVYYSGTHDNDTLLGWFTQSRDPEKILSLEQRQERCRDLMVKLYRSPALWVILPIQDILGLDSEARMNTPATESGNWDWRLTPGALTEQMRDWLKELAQATNRIRS